MSDNQLAPRYYSGLVGARFVDGGRGPLEFDCVGMLIEIQRRLGRTMPDYASNVSLLAGALVDHWDQVNSPQPGDGVLIRSVNPRWHVAVVIDSCRMISANEAAGCVCIERFDSPLYSRRIQGFYRWKS